MNHFELFFNLVVLNFVLFIYLFIYLFIHLFIYLFIYYFNGNYSYLILANEVTIKPIIKHGTLKPTGITCEEILL